jgi:hypothetical protein
METWSYTIQTNIGYTDFVLRSETIEAASFIHSGTPENNCPTLDGLWHTIVN